MSSFSISNTQPQHWLRYASIFMPLAVLFMLFGCALPKQQPLPTPHPALLTHTDDEQLFTSAWWKNYSDKSLNTLVELALTNNINLQKSALNTQKVLYQLRLTEVDLLPGVNASLGAQKSYNIKSGKNQSSFSANSSLSYELDLWRRIRAATKSGNAAFAASEQDLQAARISLISSVVDTWFQLAWIDQTIRLSKRNIERYQQLLDIQQEQYQAGKISANALVQSRQALLAAKTGLTNQKNSRVTAMQGLNNLLNLRSGRLLLLQPTALEFRPEVTVDLNVPLSVLAKRPDVRAAEFRLQEAWHQQTSQKRSWYPRISLHAGISSSGDTVGKIFNLPMGVGSLSISLPFLEWKTLKWQNKTAEANFKTARLDFIQTLTSAINEVKTLYHQYEYAQTTLSHNQKRYQLSKQNSEYYLERYKEGSETLANWLEALNATNDAEQMVVNDRYQVRKYEILLYKAQGMQTSQEPKRAKAKLQKKTATLDNPLKL